MLRIGITALIPPEIVYGTGNVPTDLNNFVPQSSITPKDKLCAWTAIWRELILMGQIDIDRLVVVAGGDCNNAVVDGERLELSGIPSHYFAYPHDGSPQTLHNELLKLTEFLGGLTMPESLNTITGVKKKALVLDGKRVNGKIASDEGFKLQVSCSDMGGDPQAYARRLEASEEKDVEYDYRVALLGTPPIYPDFHKFLEEIGLHVVFDEMPYEFIRHKGTSLKTIATDYAGYTFARNISYRLEFLKKELKKRKVEGIIHIHQFACHHKLEDSIIRPALTMEGYPFIPIESDMPSRTPEQIKLRLEAFKERMDEYL